MKRGLFISFEGGEGAGKTTQIKRLAASLPDAATTREPGGTPEAEALRSVFFENKGQDWPVAAALLMMFSARSLHTENFIKPAIAAGKTVLSDRYTDSTRVYQGYAGAVPLEQIETIKNIAIGDFEPDLTFILDIDPEEGLRRASVRTGNGNTFETKSIMFHHKIRHGFLDIATKNPERCVVIDATQDENVISEHILFTTTSRLKNV